MTEPTTTAPVPAEEVSGTVLVADDEENIITLLTGWIETIGYEVVCASNGEEAIEQARKHRPDIVLMDGMMPKMSGFDACAQMKKDPDLKDIPIIFLTVRNEIKDVVGGLELGAHGYMTKPFKPQELLARLRSVMRIKKLQDRLKSRTSQLRHEWAWVRAVMEQLPVPVLVFDSQGQTLHWNRSGERLTGYLESDLVRAADLPVRGEGISQLWAPDHTLDGRFEMQKKDGAWVQVRILAEPLVGPEDRGKTLVILFD